jgi:hypothetical protein
MTLSNAAKAEYFGAVHDRIERGWTKHSLDNGYGQVCLVGAIQEVVPRSQQHDLQVDLAHTIHTQDLISSKLFSPAQVTHRSGDGGLEIIEAWNDRKWRRKTQVLKLLAKKRAHYAALAKKDYIEELQERIADLEHDLRVERGRIAELEAKIAALTDAAKWWKVRAQTNVVNELSRTNKHLEELDRELEDAHVELLAASDC